MRRTALLLLALVPAGAGAQSFTRADTARLHRTLDSLAAAHRGVVGYAVRNVDTGEQLELRGDSTFPTASLIKVSVLVTLYDLVAKGEISLDDRITVLRIDKVPGSGLLQHLHDGLEITVGDAAWLMTTISDNTATNLILDKVAIRRVWQKMEALGLPRSRIHSKTFLRMTSVAMDSSVKYGLGVTTPNEMSRLFELLATGKAVSPAADSTMLRILENNGYNQMLQRYADGIVIAHKDGEGDQIRTECALFRLQSRVVACVLTKDNADRRWLIDNEAQVAMAKMGLAIISAWPRPQQAGNRE
ncbi:MAG: serine hydrolase [Gemmatimonadaceae bacterium]